MKILTDKELTTIIKKMGDLQVALAKANDAKVGGYGFYKDLSEGIMDIVNALDGENALRIFAKTIMPYFMELPE